jgi:hypothetical protein
MANSYRLASYTGDPVVVPMDGDLHTIFSTVIPANTMSADGSMLQLMNFGWMTEDTTGKSLQVEINGVGVSSFALDDANDGWLQELWLTRKAAADTLLRAKLAFTTCYGEGMTVSGNGMLHFGSLVPDTTPGIDWTKDNTLTVSAVGPKTAGATVTGLGHTVLVWP